jgi:hypothetical protein
MPLPRILHLMQKGFVRLCPAMPYLEHYVQVLWQRFYHHV